MGWLVSAYQVLESPVIQTSRHIWQTIFSLWTCLQGNLLIRLVEVGESILKVGSTVPWAQTPIAPCLLAEDASWPAASPPASLTIRTVCALNCEPEHALPSSVTLPGTVSQHWESDTVPVKDTLCGSETVVRAASQPLLQQLPMKSLPSAVNMELLALQRAKMVKHCDLQRSWWHYFQSTNVLNSPVHSTLVNEVPESLICLHLQFNISVYSLPKERELKKVAFCLVLCDLLLF